MRQSEENWICLLIDDGSTDESKKVAHRYLFDNRFRLLCQQNGGVSSARNVGINTALSLNVDTIMFIDADDWIDDDYLEKMYGLLKKHDVDIVTSIFSHDGENYSFPNAFPHVEGQVQKSGFEATKAIVEDRILMSHSQTKLFKQSLWQSIRYPEGIAYMEDPATIFKAFAKAKSVLLTDELGYHYWEASPNSGSRKPFSPKKILDGLFGYFESFNYQFEGFSEMERESIRFVSAQAIARAYLTFLPRYSPKHATPEEHTQFTNYQKIIRQERIIQRFRPLTRKEYLKKRLYLFSKTLYILAFRHYARKAIQKG